MTQNTYHKQTADLIARIAQNMPEMDPTTMQGWIENPKALQKALREALCPPEATPVFRVWKTITIGTKSVKELRKEILRDGMKIGSRASDILDKVEVCPKPMKLDLVVLSVKELGFKSDATYSEICAKAKSLALELCPPEVGPQLRLQYQDHPKGKWIVIAMEAIRDSSDYLSLFDVGRDGDGVWLDAFNGSPGHLWEARHCFAFVSRK